MIRTTLPALLALSLLVVTTACSESEGGGNDVEAGLTSGAGSDPSRGDATTTKGGMAEETLAPYQAELLDLAYDAVSAMPLRPHIKNRSRGQEAVVVAALELGQPERALRYAEGIANWRKGVGFADVAIYLAQKGEKQAVEPLLQRANGASESVFTDDNPQKWRRDRIRAKIARAYYLLGNREMSTRFGQGLEDSQAIELAGVVADSMPPESFEAELKRIDGVLKDGSFAAIQVVLATCAGYYDRFYEQTEKRDQVRSRVLTGYSKLPLQLRLDLIFQMVDVAAEREDQAEARSLLGEARKLMRGIDWMPKHHLPVLARLAEASFRAGDVKRATVDLETALEIYRGKLPAIVNIDRAGALRPVAEVYAKVGDQATALECYLMAIEAGVENPNSRPRAHDLAETCCSMARSRIEPDAKTWKRLRAIRKELDQHPW